MLKSVFYKTKKKNQKRQQKTGIPFIHIFIITLAKKWNSSIKPG